MSDDLQRFLDGEPVMARPLSWPKRIWRWCLHEPVVAGLVATLLAVLVGVAVVSSWAAWRLNEQAEQLTKQAKREKELAAAEREAREQAEHENVVSQLIAAASALERNDLRQAKKSSAISTAGPANATPILALGGTTLSDTATARR